MFETRTSRTRVALGVSMAARALGILILSLRLLSCLPNIALLYREEKADLEFVNTCNTLLIATCAYMHTTMKAISRVCGPSNQA